jgi:hypothetical protein
MYALLKWKPPEKDIFKYIKLRRKHVYKKSGPL